MEEKDETERNVEAEAVRKNGKHSKAKQVLVL